MRSGHSGKEDCLLNMVTAALPVGPGHIGTADITGEFTTKRKRDNVAKYLALKSELTKVKPKNILENNCYIMCKNEVIVMIQQVLSKRSIQRKLAGLCEGIILGTWLSGKLCLEESGEDEGSHGSC